MEKEQHLFVSLRVKLILAFTLLFLVINGAVFYWFYSYARDVAWQRIDSELKVVLSGTVRSIDGDAFEQLAGIATAEVVTTATENDYPYPSEDENPLYWNHVRELARVKQFELDPERKDEKGESLPRARLYTFIKGKDEHEVVFVGSAGAPDSGAGFLEVCTDAPDDCTDLTTNYAALNGQDFVIQPGVYTDDFGSWHSGYMPIRNSGGNVVGALGVDFEADYVDTVQAGVTRVLAIAGAVSLLVLIVLVLLISGILTRPIRALTEVAERLGKGEYNQDISGLLKGKFQDEIGKLAATFGQMMALVGSSHKKLETKVEESEEELKEKVKKLEEMNKYMVDRELKMTELKKENDSLRAQIKK